MEYWAYFHIYTFYINNIMLKLGEAKLIDNLKIKTY